MCRSEGLQVDSKGSDKLKLKSCCASSQLNLAAFDLASGYDGSIWTRRLEADCHRRAAICAAKRGPIDIQTAREVDVEIVAMQSCACGYPPLNGRRLRSKKDSPII